MTGHIRRNSREDSTMIFWFYTAWLSDQPKTLSTSTLSVVVGHDLRIATQWTLPLAEAFSAIAKMRQGRPNTPSIDGIAEHLTEERGVLEVIIRKERPLEEARNLVFTVLGWQTILISAGAWDLPSPAAGSSRRARRIRRPSVHGAEAQPPYLQKDHSMIPHGLQDPAPVRQLLYQHRS